MRGDRFVACNIPSLVAKSRRNKARARDSAAGFIAATLSYSPLLPLFLSGSLLVSTIPRYLDRPVSRFFFVFRRVIARADAFYDAAADNYVRGDRGSAIPRAMTTQMARSRGASTIPRDAS